MAGDDAGSQVTPLARCRQNTLEPRYIRARILWPALGFPEVIDPKDSASALNGTNCINLLLLAEEKDLTSHDVARHLRYVPWERPLAGPLDMRPKGREDRRTRYLPPSPGTCSFAGSAIEVHEVKPDEGKIRTTRTEYVGHFPLVTEEFGEGVVFARGHVAASLAKFVRKFYSDQGLPHLYQVSVQEAASAQLKPGLYNLFWVNRNWCATPNDLSEEMRLLIDKFAEEPAVS